MMQPFLCHFAILQKNKQMNRIYSFFEIKDIFYSK